MFVNNNKAQNSKPAMNSAKSRQSSMRLKQAYAMLRGGAPAPHPETGTMIKAGNRVGKKPY